MNVPQLRRKVKALIGRINKNKKTIDGLKKELVDLQKAKSTREKKYKKDMDHLDCKLRDQSESHKNQIAVIHDIHAEDMAKKDAMIHDYSVKLQELRKTSNIDSYTFIFIS